MKFKLAIAALLAPAIMLGADVWRDNILCRGGYESSFAWCDPTFVVPAKAEDDCAYQHRGRALKSVVREAGADHVTCTYK